MDERGIGPVVADAIKIATRGEKIADSGRVLSIENAEVNPLQDTANQTARLAVDLVLLALGKQEL